MPSVIMGNVPLKTDLDDYHRKFCCAAFEEIRQPSLQGLQPSGAKFTKFTGLTVEESNQVRISNRQQPRHIREVEAIPKFALGHIDCIQIVHLYLLRLIAM